MASSSTSTIGLRHAFSFSLYFVVVVVDALATSDRPMVRETFNFPGTTGPDKYSAQQVHISMVGLDKVKVTWITRAHTIPIVYYGLSPGLTGVTRASGTIDNYRFGIYRSGFIHNVVIGPLNPNTVYYYKCGINSSRELSFKTPPARLPVNFVVVGDLGQTRKTRTNLDHIDRWEHDMLILPGDLAYAGGYQPSWDSFGRLVEPLASKRPWMVTQGNHEIEKILPFMKPFKAYNYRWTMPYKMSGSNSNLYYSFDTAGGAVHVVMLGSYTDYDLDSDQYSWLRRDLMKVDRKKTPWVFAVMHIPWYNTNVKHQGEAEKMRHAMESLLYKARVDVVFAGHVHAYERFDRVFSERADPCGPFHITVGCGGNKEGLATKYTNPKPQISLFREASFGHGRLQVLNATHAYWTWQRNQDNSLFMADGAWLTSLSSNPECFSECRVYGENMKRMERRMDEWRAEGEECCVRPVRPKEIRHVVKD